MSAEHSFHTLKGDLSGGIHSGIVAITGNMAFGIVAFAPLGPGYIGHGILAGMFSSIIGGLFAALTGGAPGMITGPKITTALLFGSLLGQLLATGFFNISSAADVSILLTLAFGAVLLSGLIQLFFGITRMGIVIKFIPYPVIAAILNCTALLIIEGQLAGCLGLPEQGFLDVLRNINDIEPFTFIVAVVTALLAWQGDRFLYKALVPVMSIAAGTCLYYIIGWAHPTAALGPVLGEIPSAFPRPEYVLKFFNVFSNPEYVKLLPSIIPIAVTMAFLNSFSTLIALITLQNFSGQRLDANRELTGQGIGNIAGSLFGGISSAGFVSRTAQNFNGGGRSKFSGAASSLTVLLLILLLSDVIALVPKAAFSGLVLLIGCQIFDKWSLKQTRDLLSGRKTNSETILNVMIFIVVIILGMVYDLVTAVFAGVIISIIVFVVQMSRTPVRRCYSGSHVQSRKSRPLEQMQALSEKSGAMIAVLELEGAIFFGSADSIASKIDTVTSDGAKYVILDLKRVARIDSTAARLIEQARARLLKEDRILALSYVPEQGDSREFIEGLGIVQSLGEENIFEDTDRALEYFEEKLLKDIAVDDSGADRLSLHQTLGLDVLAPEDAAMIADYITRDEYAEGEYVIRQGTEAAAIFFIVKGSADSTIYLPDVNRTKRMGTYTEGTYFGESVLLEKKASPVSIVATEPLVCYKITLKDFEKMKQEAPALAMAIMTTINRTMAFRLNKAIDMISELDR